MKFTKLFSLIFLILSVSSFAQNQWYIQSSGVNNFLFDVHFVDEDNGWIAGNTGLILNTTDGGATWNEQTTPPNNTYYSMFFTDTQNGWAGGFAGKLIRTTDGGATWIDGTAGTNRFRYDLYFINPDSGWVVGGDNGGYPSFIPNREILFTSDGGITWNVQYGQSNKAPLNAVYFIDKNNGFAVGESGAVMQTTNGGNSWIETNTLTSYHLRDVTFIDQNTGWVLGYYLGLPHTSAVFKTTDGGSTWSEQTFGVDESFSSISFADEMNGWIVGGQSSPSNSYILHTTDGGENWEYLVSPTNEYLVKVFFFNNNAGWAVGASGTIIATENTVPVELTSFTASVTENNVTLLWETATETNNSGFEIFRADESNVFEKLSFIEGSGTTTQKKSYSYTDKNVSAGNYSYQLIQVDYDGTRNELEPVSVEVAGASLNEYKLSQNYPNPFNPVTNIQYTLPASGNVTLSVFNAIGEEVLSLVNEFKEAGSHQVSVNAANLNSGIYFYTLTTGSFKQTKKMMLLK